MYVSPACYVTFNKTFLYFFKKTKSTIVYDEISQIFGIFGKQAIN